MIERFWNIGFGGLVGLVNVCVKTQNKEEEERVRQRECVCFSK